MKILVCSIPKAGTYFISNLLKEAGFQPTNWHIGATGWQDYGDGNLEKQRHNPETYTKIERPESVIQRIPEGHFAVSHLGPHQIGSFDGHVIFVRRDLRSVLPSFHRWINDGKRWLDLWPKRDYTSDQISFLHFLFDCHPRIYFEIQQASQWIGQTGSRAFSDVSYEGLTGEFGAHHQDQEIRALFTELGIEDKFDGLSRLIDQAKAAKSLTKLEKKTSVSYTDIWTDESKLLFDRLGYSSLNRKLGYEGTGIACNRLFYLAAPKESIACPVCECKTTVDLPIVDRYQMRLTASLCDRCGHGFVDPMPTVESVQNFYKNSYWELYVGSNLENERSKSRFRSHQILHSVFRHAAFRPAKAIDVGSGSGGMLYALREYFGNIEVTATEPSDQAVKDLLELGFTDVHHHDWQTVLADKPEGHYDFLTCTHVLEHLREPRKIVKNCVHHLADGGYAYFEVPNLLSDKWSGSSFFHIGHLQYFQPWSLERLLREAGLAPLAVLHGETIEWPWGVGILCRKSPDARSQAPLTRHPEASEVIKHVRSRLNAPSGNLKKALNQVLLHALPPAVYRPIKAVAKRILG